MNPPIGNPKPSFSPARRWAIGFNVVIATLALLAIVTMANYVSARHFKRFHWTAQDRSPLSPMTVHLLQSVTNRIQVVIFFDRRDALYAPVSDLIEQYRMASRNMEVDRVDYRLNPGRAQLIENKYQLDPGSRGSRVIFHGNGRTYVVYETELSTLDYSDFMEKRIAKRTQFKGEQLFTSAIYRLLDTKQPTAVFLKGHREHDPASEDNEGYSKFTRLLKENHIQVETRSLLTDDLPPDALLIIPGPQQYLPSVELDKIDKFLNQGGRLLVSFIFDAKDKNTGLEKLLGKWGVEVGQNSVSDKAQSRSGAEVFPTSFGSHPVVQPLLRSRLQLILPRSISRKAEGPRGADAPKVDELFFSSPESTALITLSADKVKTERTGSIPLAVAVEKGNIQGVTADRGATRLVVLGDSYFLDNAGIDQEANYDFARLAVNWLLNRDVLLQGIGPRPVREYQVTLTESQLSHLRFLFLGAFPGGTLFLGLVVWLRRRK